MTAVTLPGIGLTGDWAYLDANWHTGVNSNWRKMTVLSNTSVWDRVPTVPSSPSEGMSVILTSSPNQNSIATYFSGSWFYITPTRGCRAFDAASNKFYYFSGTDWVPEIDMALLAPGMTLIAAASGAGNPSVIDFTSGMDSTYNNYKLVIERLRVSASTDLNLRTRDTGSSSFDTSNYQFNRQDINSVGNAPSSSLSAAYSASAITISSVAPANASAGLSGEIDIFGASTSDRNAGILFRTGWANTSTNSAGSSYGSGSQKVASGTSIMGLRLFPASGTFTEGNAYLYGMRKEV